MATIAGWVIIVNITFIQIVAMPERNTLQHALGPFLVIAQFFGVFPISGVGPGCMAENIRFHWLSPVIVLTGCAYFFAGLDFVLSARLLIQNGLKIYTMGSLNFSVICIFCFGVFLSLSRHWPQLAERTARCELIFHEKRYSCPLGNQFGHRLRIWGFALTLAALCEHLTYVGSAVYSNYMQIHECKLNVDFWQNYFQRERHELFSIMDYNVWIIPFLEWTTLSMTFVWSFVDIFLILICRSMEMRFKQFHWHLRQYNWQRQPIHDFWQETLSDLLELSDLFKLYDKHLSGLILCSCAHNMYFICVQIYHSFQAKGGYMDELYFWFCLGYVIARISNMMFAASSIPQEAKEISYTLYEVPTKLWCVELERLNEIFRFEAFALSGKGYFFMTRRLIFAMAATLMVYELVLVNQLAGSEVQKSICSRGAGSSMSIFYS